MNLEDVAPGEISRTPAVEGRNLCHLTCMWELKQPHAMRAWGAGGQAARASGRQSSGARDQESCGPEAQRGDSS